MKLVSIIIFTTASLLCLAVLRVLHSQLRIVYGKITAWRFIFAGVGLLIVENLLFLFWVVTADYEIGAEWVITSMLSLCRVVCYLIGFTLWAGQRRELFNQPDRRDILDD